MLHVFEGKKNRRYTQRERVKDSVQMNLKKKFNNIQRQGEQTLKKK